MDTKQIIFFATFVDIEPTLRSVEESLLVQYFGLGLFDTRDIPHYKSIFEIPKIDRPTSGDWNKDRWLLMIPQDTQLVINEIPQRSGGIKFDVELPSNLNGGALQLGGVLEEGIIIAGKFTCVPEDEFSKQLFKIFSKIKKEFRKIGEAYVGRQAEEKLRGGWRLVTSDSAPKEYDFKL